MYDQPLMIPYKENAFIVHKENEIIKFQCSFKGLYQYEISKDYKKKDKQVKQYKDGTSSLISTVTENRNGYTSIRQFERAKEARKLYHSVGTTTMDNFKLLLQMNIINKSCPVTTEMSILLRKYLDQMYQV